MSSARSHGVSPNRSFPGNIHHHCRYGRVAHPGTALAPCQKESSRSPSNVRKLVSLSHPNLCNVDAPGLRNADASDTKCRARLETAWTIRQPFGSNGHMKWICHCEGLCRPRCARRRRSIDRAKRRCLGSSPAHGAERTTLRSTARSDQQISPFRLALSSHVERGATPTNLMDRLVRKWSI
jgi:hypothetical protein